MAISPVLKLAQNPFVGPGYESQTLRTSTPLAELEVSRWGWHELFQSSRKREGLSVVELLNVPMEWQALNTFNVMLKYAYRALCPCRVTSRSSVRLVSENLYSNSAWYHRPVIMFNTLSPYFLDTSVLFVCNVITGCSFVCVVVCIFQKLRIFRIYRISCLGVRQEAILQPGVWAGRRGGYSLTVGN